MEFTYLLLNIFTISYPAYAFKDKRINYYQRRKALLGAILVTGLFFVAWDHYFTKWNIWSFNPDYTLGLYIGALPIEEWLFFITVPFACLFIYEVVGYFFPKVNSPNFSKRISWFLVATFSIISIVSISSLYTSVTFALAAVALLLHLISFGARYLTRFYITYLLHLVPFFIVNGILTALPVVQYNNNQNLQIRLGTIPVEDTVYSFLMLLMLVSFYEAFSGVLKQRKLLSV